MNRHHPHHPDRPAQDDARVDGRYAYRERLAGIPNSPPALDYPYSPSFSQSGGGYVDSDTGPSRGHHGGDYQQVRPWGPQDGTSPHGEDPSRRGAWGDQEWREGRREAGGGRDDHGYGPDIEPPQDHRGRGPRNYQRSDERLREDVCESLTDDPRIDASQVDVEVSGRCVTLTGEVDSRRTKHLIEDLVDRCRGVESIDNRLRVAGMRKG